MISETPHICICICTYKRPEFLRRLLNDLARQETDGRFTFSILVVDNDSLQSARSVLEDFAAHSPVPATYCVEPRQNISLARNKALEGAKGDLIAFIDDDEFPTGRWLLTLFEAREKYGVDGALGPVKPHFDVEPPRWIVKGKFYDRATYPTGFIIDWRKGRTGNLLFDARILADEKQPFRPEFLAGEDQDFFRRMIAKGYVFVWCDEAVAYETVPPTRWKRTFMLKRALQRGAVSLLNPGFGPRDIAKSIMAVPAYSVALPFAVLFGQHWFMTVLVRLFDHAGTLLAVLGIKPVKRSYVTE